jgi:hypothetical protein
MKNNTSAEWFTILAHGELSTNIKTFAIFGEDKRPRRTITVPASVDNNPVTTTS